MQAQFIRCARLLKQDAVHVTHLPIFGQATGITALAQCLYNRQLQWFPWVAYNFAVLAINDKDEKKIVVAPTVFILLQLITFCVSFGVRMARTT